MLFYYVKYEVLKSPVFSTVIFPDSGNVLSLQYTLKEKPYAKRDNSTQETSEVQLTHRDGGFLQLRGTLQEDHRTRALGRGRSGMSQLWLRKLSQVL